jgi:hypothetical protein
MLAETALTKIGYPDYRWDECILDMQKMRVKLFFTTNVVRSH